MSRFAAKAVAVAGLAVGAGLLAIPSAVAAPATAAPAAAASGSNTFIQTADNAADCNVAKAFDDLSLPNDGSFYYCGGANGNELWLFRP